MLVSGLSNKKFGALNVVTYNPQQFDKIEPIMLSCNGTVYRSISDPDTVINSIGMNQFVRQGHNLAFNDKIDVFPVNESSLVFIDPPSFIIINVHNIGGTKTQIIDLTTPDLQNSIYDMFKDYPLHEGQHLVLKHDAYYFHIKSNTTSKLVEFDKTLIEVSSINPKINIRQVDTSLLRSRFFDPDFSFEEIGIGGLDDELKEIFKQAMTSRAYSPDVIKKLGTKHAKGVLLYGPPGVGKTLIARNIGNLLSCVKAKLINGPEIFNKYVGQSEENIRTIFKEAIADQESLGEHSPVHVFIFDEFDAICKVRGSNPSSAGVGDSVVNQLLSLIDGVNVLNNIFIIAMTNRKDLIDPAILRAGRIGIHVPISLPSKIGRRQILCIHTQKMSENSMLGKDVDLDYLAEITDNYSGSELAQLVETASGYALHDALIMKEELIEVVQEDFLKAFSKIKPNMARLLDESHTVPDSAFFEDRLVDLKSHLDTLGGLVDGDNVRLVIQGSNPLEKTYLINQIIKESDHPYIAVIRPSMLVGKDEHTKNSLLIEKYRSALLFPRALIIIDDLESLVNYLVVEHIIDFSRTCIQTFLGMMKSITDKRSIDVVVTCTEPTLSKLFTKIGVVYDIDT